jgi:choline dehydrogenase-like flavoprotein
LKALRPREADVFAALADAYCGPGSVLPPVSSTDAVVFIDDLAARSRALNRIAFKAILRLIDLVPLARGYGARFTALSPERRAEFVRALDHSRSPLLNIAFRLLKTLALMSYYGDVNVLRATGYDPGTPRPRPAPAPVPNGKARLDGVRPTGESAYRDASGAFVPSEVRIVHGSQLRRNLAVRVDVCVIGTGAGGAPVAKELAEAGLSVAMLEEGEHHVPSDYTARPRDMSTLLYRDGGQIATLGVPPILLPLGRTVGGSTHVNSATCFRTPSAVLEMWAGRFGLEQLTPAELEPYFRRVERELNVVQTPASIAGRNAEVVKRGADRLGYSGDFVYRNVRGCVGSGVCNFGCPTAAKQHVGVTYVPKAWEAGATTYSGTRARRLVLDGRRVRGVEAVTGSGRKLRIACDVVVIAAGTVHTPLLIRRSGLGDTTGQLGRNLSLHPATGVRALFDEPIDMWAGVPQSYYIDEFANEGIMLEGAAGTPDWVATSLPYFGERHRGLMDSVRNLSQFGVMVSDTSRGRVREVAGVPLVRYGLDHRDTQLFKRAIEILADIYWAAGAKRVYPPIAGLPELGPDDMPRLRELQLTPAQLSLIAFHPLGTCRMGADPAAAPVAPDGALRGYEGVYVADGSIVPSSLGVNPQITIMTLATRIAFGIAGKPAPEGEPRPERMAEPRVAVAHL